MSAPSSTALTAAPRLVYVISKTMPASAAALVVPEKQASYRNPDGTFPRGTSGNPNGRPRNPDSITVALRAKVYGNLPEFVDALYNVAVKDKNVVAMKEI